MSTGLTVLYACSASVWALVMILAVVLLGRRRRP